MKTKYFLNLGRSAGLVMGAGFALTASAGTPNYTVGQSLVDGSSVYSLVTGDFMGNGHKGIITADGSVWVGDGTGNFTAGPTVPTASYLAVADVNGDGKPDLIETYDNNQVAVLLNITQPGDSVPSFAAPVYFNAGNNAAVVTTADVNGDGKPDLIITDINAYTVNVLLNTTVPGSSTVTFGNFQAFPTGNGANWLAVADMNGDGKPDLMVLNNLDNTISVYINTTPNLATSASFTAQQVFSVGNFPNMVTTADINGDGSQDIVVANNSENTISVLLNTTPNGSTAASFAAEETFPTGRVPDSVVAVDVDGDGRPDLVAANAMDGTISVLQNTTTPGSSTASFASQINYTVGGDPENLVFADLNGDGKPDLAVLNVSDPSFGYMSSVSILLNTSF
ncbi:MAG TPA: VCBS repeat-containing protein [Gammaproteobacteria bacterium]|nr:VCBS repeat-containing protein [Gammaproteobacteria bacterium]